MTHLGRLKREESKEVCLFDSLSLAPSSANSFNLFQAQTKKLQPVRTIVRGVAVELRHGLGFLARCTLLLHCTAREDEGAPSPRLSLSGIARHISVPR